MSFGTVRRTGTPPATAAPPQAGPLQQLIALDAAATPARPAETITYQRDKSPRAPRPTPAETFAHLPVRETIVIVPDEVKTEPEAFEQIGEERTFEVDIVAPQLFRREIVRPKFLR